MKRSAFNQYLDRQDFASLFITELGWNNPSGPTNLPAIEIDGTAYRPKIVAQRSGFKIITCAVNAIPTTSVCRRIDLKLRQYANEYLLIFTLKGNVTHHLWLAPVKKVDKRDIVTTEYASADQAEFIYQKIDNLAFGYDEVTTIVDVRDRVQGSFAVNSEKITKDFYTGFKKEHKAFASFIKGIEGTATTEHDRQWYASVMLNRLMFCYFIQKKGFLNGEDNYLRNRFEKHVAGEQNGTFFRSFYLDFLRQLFQDGLNDPQRNAEFRAKYGLIPYLNGGMFDEHQIERDYADLDIADAAFDRLFTFFDRWNWHLDTRITASGKDINPDVLGYIFEQYINDRAQMGAYYTKEDITEYIGRNCILPFLFDKTMAQAADAMSYFAPDGFVWTTLRESGDRYIFDAVKHGFDDFAEIPENIAVGIDTTMPGLLERRKDWNTRTPERWGLSTEIWRETIERLQRCGSVLDKIKGGEITSINDFITYNLDIRQFAQDLLARADHRFVKWFYTSLQNVSILDPTCGSGAFLFAALNILEPLYEICIDRMQDFNRQNPNLFKEQLAEITSKYRSNIQYFIYKSIILRNLYGVDIMVEATEIAKLRLFLKMVAVVDVDRRAENMGLDPLPDIDFNIRCGNTLVGYVSEEELNRDLADSQGDMMIMMANDDFKARIDEEMLKVKDTFNRFRDIQLNHGDDMASFKQAKHDLNVRLSALREQLNLRLHSATSNEPFDKWLTSHQPFHWLAEYYGIIQGNGGFDVIIGNPPYVVYSNNKFDYQIRNYLTIKARNLYAFCIERALRLVNKDSYLSLIVPISLSNGSNYFTVRQLLANRGTVIYSHYAGDSHPSCLFNGVQQNLTIFNSSSKGNATFTTNYVKSYNEERINLFKTLRFNEIDTNSREIFRLGSSLQTSICRKINDKGSITSWLSTSIGNTIFFKNTSGAAYKPFFSQPPFFQVDGVQQTSKTIDSLSFSTNQQAQSALGMFNSNLFNFLFLLVSDARYITPRETLGLLTVDASLANDSNLHRLSSRLQNDYNKHSIIVTYNKKNGVTEYAQFNPRLSKPIIDEIDKVLAEHYGFTEEELDFIINYDIKYRMGEELNSDE